MNLFSRGLWQKRFYKIEQSKSSANHLVMQKPIRIQQNTKSRMYSKTSYLCEHGTSFFMERGLAVTYSRDHIFLEDISHSPRVGMINGRKDILLCETISRKLESQFLVTFFIVIGAKWKCGNGYPESRAESERCT